MGKGASGEVKKCRLGHTEVVLKTVASLESIEVVALKRLCGHPNIVMLLGGFRLAELDRPCKIILEPAQHDLSTALHDRYLPVDDRVFQDLARGVGHVHANKLAHCDLKSPNVLLIDGRAKLCDFGISCELADGRLQGSPPKGTALWMAPECSDCTVQTAQRDIWSLGIIYLEILCRIKPWYLDLQILNEEGAMPKDREDLCEWVCQQLRHSERPFPRAVLSKVDEIVARCLSFPPEERPTPSELEQHFAAAPPERLANNSAEACKLMLKMLGRKV